MMSIPYTKCKRHMYPLAPPQKVLYQRTMATGKNVASFWTSHVVLGVVGGFGVGPGTVTPITGAVHTLYGKALGGIFQSCTMTDVRHAEDTAYAASRMTSSLCSRLHSAEAEGVATDWPSCCNDLMCGEHSSRRGRQCTPLAVWHVRPCGHPKQDSRSAPPLSIRSI